MSPADVGTGNGHAPGTTDSLAFLARTVRPHWRLLLLHGTAMVVAAALAVVPPLVYRQIIDVAIPGRDAGLLLGLLAALLALAVAGPLVEVGKQALSCLIGEALVLDLRARLFAHLMGLRIETFLYAPTGELMSRLHGDVLALRNTVDRTLGVVLSNVLALLAIGATMVVVDWRLALPILALTPCLVIGTHVVRHRAQRLSREGLRRSAALMATLSRTLTYGGATHLRLLGSVPGELRGLEAAGRDLRTHAVRQTVFYGSYRAVLAVLSLVAVALVYGGGAVLSWREGLTIGTVVAMAAFVAQLHGPLTALTALQLDVVELREVTARVQELLRRPVVEPVEHGGSPGQRLPGDVELDGASFCFAPADQVSFSRHEPQPAPLPTAVHGVTLRFPAGSRVALVGPSGAGKTTLALVIARLHVADTGTVRIGGRDVRGLSGATLRRTVSVVMQDPFFFPGSVRENITYARPEATAAEIVRACRTARVHDVIASLPMGYATDMGDVGLRFSGGERQRLAIARALVCRPSVLILDEAMSMLDNDTALAVEEGLQTLPEDCTVILISHRLALTRNADIVVSLDEGRVQEVGDPAALANDGGLYARLLAAEGAAAGGRPD